MEQDLCHCQSTESTTPQSQNTWKFTLWLFFFSPDYKVFLYKVFFFVLGETERDLTNRRVLSLLCGQQQRWQVLELVYHHRVGTSLPSELQGGSSPCILSLSTAASHTQWCKMKELPILQMWYKLSSPQ